MWYILLVFIILILVLSLLMVIKTIRSINRQVKEKRRIRVPLANKDLEELAYQINQKDTLHQKLEIQVKQEEEQLKQSISNISHDLRTPLTSMQGYLTLLEESENTEEREQYIKIIKAKTDYLTNLVQEFYDLSVLENDSTDMSIEKIDINKIVTDCLLEKYHEFDKIQPIIRTEKVPVWISGNELICKRIIENLIINAIRYSDGFIEISVDSKGTFTAKNSTYSLKDTDIDQLFDKFYTADKSRTNGSSGLGLYIVKKLLERINGIIEMVDYENSILTISIRFSLYS